MKKLMFLICVLLMSSELVNSQIAITPKVGTSVLYGVRTYAGVELQASCVSMEARYYAVKFIDFAVINGFSLFGTMYLDCYYSSPYLSIGIITEGSKHIDVATGKPIRSMPIFLGYRYYPKRYDKISYNFSGGIELIRNMSVRPYLEVSMNYALFKSRKF